MPEQVCSCSKYIFKAAILVSKNHPLTLLVMLKIGQLQLKLAEAIPRVGECQRSKEKREGNVERNLQRKQIKRTHKCAIAGLHCHAIKK